MTRIHRQPFQTLLLVAILFSVGCAPETEREGPGTRTVTDDLGREIVIPDTIRRVVTLAPSVTELVFAAGAGERIVGVTDADNFPPAVDTIARIQALPINFETVVSLQPDLAIASSQVNDPRDAASLQALGIPTWFVQVRTLSDVPRSIDALGDVLGTAEEAAAAADSLRTIQASYETLAPPSRPVVMVLVGDETLFSFGSGSYVHDLVYLAGGISLTAEFSTEAPVLSDEYVLVAKPDVIIGAFGPTYDPATLLRLHPAWEIVPAVRDRRVYSIEPDHILRPGPRLYLGIRDIRNALGRPEIELGAADKAVGADSAGRPTGGLRP